MSIQYLFVNKTKKEIIKSKLLTGELEDNDKIIKYFIENKGCEIFITDDHDEYYFFSTLYGENEYKFIDF